MELTEVAEVLLASVAARAEGALAVDEGTRSTDTLGGSVVPLPAALAFSSGEDSCDECFAD